MRELAALAGQKRTNKGFCGFAKTSQDNCLLTLCKAKTAVGRTFAVPSVPKGQKKQRP